MAIRCLARPTLFLHTFILLSCGQKRPQTKCQGQTCCSRFREKCLTFQGMSDIMMTNDTIQSMIDTHLSCQCISNSVYEFVIQTELIRIEISSLFAVRHFVCQRL